MTVIAEEMPLVKIDFGLLEHALINLLLNASQHSPQGSVVKMEALYVKGNLILRVSDNGPGFPGESLPHLFDKFFRVDGSPAGGLGLGLSIVRGIVDVHKGTVSVANLETGGAMFTIAIPSELPDMNHLDLAK